MKYSLIVVLSLVFYLSKAQTEVILGQPYKDQTTLVIKNNSTSMSNLSMISTYSKVNEVKLVSFNDETSSLDSVLDRLSELKNIKIIRFEKCDLFYVNKSFDSFKSLEEIYITNNSDFFENTLFPLLKNVPLKHLYIETNYPDIITDSLVSLTKLETIELSSGKFKGKPTSINYVQIKQDNKLHLIKVNLYGEFESINKMQRDDLSSNSQSKFATTRNFGSIKPPIAGINIHDTSYTFSSTDKVSLNYYSGSSIALDKDAFQYNDGKPYQGEVKVLYREFRNPVEIMLSGIPMTNMVNGKPELFKSGGMYQINAFDKNGVELQTKSDTSVKINFALTDTASNFQFFKLNQNGSWNTVSNSINIIPSINNNSNGVKRTKAVTAYYNYKKDAEKNKADTTNFYARFDDPNYLYTFRKDNMIKNNDVLLHRYLHSRPLSRGKKYSKTKAFFRVKYYKQTKDKEIVFTIVPAKKDLDVPDHISLLMNREFLYTGGLSKQEFRNTFNRKVYCWDVRNSGIGNSVDLVIKTDKGLLNLSGLVIRLKDDRSYTVSKITGKVLNINMIRQLKRESRHFNRKDRFNYTNDNDLTNKNSNDISRDAFEYCKKFMNDEEKKMSYNDWKKYIQKFGYSLDWNELQDNDLGNALVKSGMGINNIDCYLHSGQMEDILVQYKNAPIDSIAFQYNCFLYKSINTSYPLTGTGEYGLSGYYFKKRDNYLIRLSEDGYMQVTKPQEVLASKNERTISLTYSNQYYIKGMSSDEITKLILK